MSSTDLRLHYRHARTYPWYVMILVLVLCDLVSPVPTMPAMTSTTFPTMSTTDDQSSTKSHAYYNTWRLLLVVFIIVAVYHKWYIPGQNGLSHQLSLTWLLARTLGSSELGYFDSYYSVIWTLLVVHSTPDKNWTSIQLVICDLETWKLGLQLVCLYHPKHDPCYFHVSKGLTPIRLRFNFQFLNLLDVSVVNSEI